jgi:DmsE family decaheme c-type cytochrome
MLLLSLSILSGLTSGLTLFASPARAEATYIGSEVCAGCHAPDIHAYGQTIHARFLNSKNASSAIASRGCEGCHGPGSLHVKNGGRGPAGTEWVSFGSTDAAGIQKENEACLACHAGSTQKLWEGSAHESHDVGCASCHTVMNPVSRKHLLKSADQTTMCSSCHLLPRAQQLRNRHMPTRTGAAGVGGEGWMDCGSCHNPHGTVADHLVSALSVNENCYSCHAEKRGPFLWEHAPVNENCLNCHDAHGSIRPDMLKIPGPRLCQTCHIESLHPSQNRGPGDRFSVGQNCGHCHSKVHGSNHPSGSFLTR